MAIQYWKKQELNEITYSIDRIRLNLQEVDVERAYERYLRQAPLARLPLESMTSSMLQQFYNELDCTPSGLDALHKMLIICFRYFSREGRSRNLTENLILPKKKNKKNIKPRSKNRNIEVWEEHELELITANLGNNRIRFLILLAMYTGCRISELLAIKYGDIHDGALNISKQIINAPVRENNKIIRHQLEVSEPKTIHSYRAIPLTEGLLEELERHRKWHQDEMKENGYSTVFNPAATPFQLVKMLYLYYQNRLSLRPSQYTQGM